MAGRPAAVASRSPSDASGEPRSTIRRSSSRRPRGSWRRGRGPSSEVRRRLTGAGYQPDLVEGAITRMTELGMLDDETFARAWVESPRPGSAAWRAGDPRGAPAQGHRPRDDRRRAWASDASWPPRPPRPTARTRPWPGPRGGRTAAGQATPGAWPASPTHASAGSAPTRCSRATASTPRRAGRSRPRPASDAAADEP